MHEGLTNSVSWIRRNLFPTPASSLLTLVLGGIAGWLFVHFIDWAVINAVWFGDSKSSCSGEGACWAFITARAGQLAYGFFPEEARWRADIVMGLGLLSIGLLMIKRLPFATRIFALLATLAICYWLLAGGGALPEIESRLWGGFLLTLVITIVGCGLAFPLGILLALGRQSRLPIIRVICTGFIEFWRGIPLITVLFMASVMLPLFLPDGLELDKLLRALIGVILFAGAYMAEVVRGGLQSLPRGQYEAAMALGLGYWQTMRTVILPQALRRVIPGLINTVIGLFKDTTLVLIIGMFDFLGVLQAGLADPAWLGLAMEAYLFAALVYWVFCYGLSRLGKVLEARRDLASASGMA